MNRLLDERFRGYSLLWLRRDLLSGIIVGIVAIPLGLSFAIASGVQPIYGIYTIIVAGILISLLGGSKYQIGGPTGAFVPVLLAIVLAEGYDNLLICGLMAGIILLLAGLLRFGTLIRYMPRPVIVGFTAGIAVIIFSGQIANFLGLTGMRKHEDFLPNMEEILLHLRSVNVYSVLTAVISLAVIILVPRISRRLPSSIFGLAISSIIAGLLYPGQVATIGSTFGAMTGGLPHLQLPAVTWVKLLHLLPSAAIVAMLGGIESLLSAVVADQMTGTKHNSNRELIGQGLANIVAPLFGGIPATGAIARTATNIRSGAASPVSGIVHGVVVLLVLLAFAKYASAIPLASMAPILIVVAWNMSERKEFAHLLRSRSGDAVILAVTFLLTVLTSLTIAVGAGLVLAVIVFIIRMGQTVGVAQVVPDPASKNRKVRPSSTIEAQQCPQIHIYTLQGPMFFGASPALERAVTGSSARPDSVTILRMGKMPYLDTSGEQQLLQAIRLLRKLGVSVFITGLQAQPRELLSRTRVLDEIGETNMFAHTGETLQFAISRAIDHDRCKGCTQYAFQECGCLSRGEVPDGFRTAKIQS